jgi:FkbM family methyltransferase
MKNKIIEKLSWIPYNLLMAFGKKKKKEKLILNFNKIGINKRFIFYLDKKDEGLSSQLKAFGFREPINSYYYYNFIKKQDVVLDIGANMGYFTLLSENAKKIICVEPIKKLLPLLIKNIEENGLKKKCEIINAVVSKGENKLLFEIKKELNFSKVVKNKNKETFEIKSFPLKDLVKKYRPNTLRMDLEGYEYELLMKNIPKNIKKISLELHTWILGKRKVIQLMNYLDKEGFIIKYLTEDIPLRMYPFYNLFKKIGKLNKINYVKNDLNSKGNLDEILNGKRQLKYLFLERK